MSKQILVNASHYETRVATLENGEIRQLHIEREEDRNVVGNIYKGVVKRVLPGMQAAFLELGLERTAFLYVDDIVEDPFGSDVDYEDEVEEGDPDEVLTQNEGEEDGEPVAERAEIEPPQKRPDDLFVNPKDRPEAVSKETKEVLDTREVRETRETREVRDTRDTRDLRETSSKEESDTYSDEPYSASQSDRSEGQDDDYDRNEPREAGSEDSPQREGRGPSRREGGRDQGSSHGGRRGGGGNYRARPRPRRRTHGGRRPRQQAQIQDLIKEGQEILVQVAKAPIGTKGARLTTHISLPGRNLVLMPTVRHLGISRRIEGERERRRLRDLFMKKIRPKGVGFIIRTVAGGKSLKELKADTDYLVKLWGKIRKDAAKKRAPALIHEDLSLQLRAVRDFFTDEVDSFVIDNPEEYDQVMGFIGQFMPRLKNRVKFFKGPTQLFEHYGIEAEISRALGKKVWLKSGGYLLVDQSEALTAIDVNTGRYVGSKSLEETILKTNLEAVKEVAYQLRVRNVGGIIIIDLIDMENNENREIVYQALQEALGEDRARTNILKISDLGLVEMTRKRTHEDLVRYLTESCSNCEGRGYHKSRRTVCFEIFREIEKEALSPNKNIVVFAHPDVSAKMLAEEKIHVEKLQTRFSKTIHVKADPALHVEQYEVFGKM